MIKQSGIIYVGIVFLDSIVAIKKTSVVVASLSRSEVSLEHLIGI